MAFEQSSWGRLWDQTESVATHTKEGIDFFEKYGKFCYDRALIEEQYSKSLRELAKKNFGKRAPNDDSKHSFTYMSSFYTMLRELESLAGQHEVVAETLKKSIHPQINTKCAELRQTRKNQLGYLTKLNMDLSKSVEAMEKTHRNYAKAFKEAEAAHIKHEQNDKDLNLSRAAVEKSKNNVMYKNQLCEEAKKNYANALLIANDAKTKHFQVELPNLLEQMKAAEIDRINHTRLAMQKSIEAETNVMRIIQACYDEMQKAVSSINPDSDTQVVIEQNVTGYAMPDQYPFDDLGDPGQIVHQDNTSENSSTSKRGTLPLNSSKSSSKNGSLKSASIGRRQSMHQKFFGGGSNASEKPKVNGVLSDYGNLPPQQRCRKIQQKLEELEKERETLLKSLEAVEKMAEVYRSNPKMGSLKDVEPKIAEYKTHLQRINADITKFKALLENIQNEMRSCGSIYGSEGGSSDGTTISMREGDMLSLEKEKACIEHHHQNGGGTSITGYGSPRSSNGYETYDTSDSSSLNKGGTPQPLGTCIALYGFEGAPDGTTVSMKEGDQVFLLEKDVGDGWTRIRHKATQIEGFVPTSYLHCQ